MSGWLRRAYIGFPFKPAQRRGLSEQAPDHADSQRERYGARRYRRKLRGDSRGGLALSATTNIYKQRNHISG